MTEKVITRILLVEDNPGDARLLREMFKDQGSRETELTRLVEEGRREGTFAAHASTSPARPGVADAKMERYGRARHRRPHFPMVDAAIWTTMSRPYKLAGRLAATSLKPDRKRLLRALRITIELISWEKRFS